MKNLIIPEIIEIQLTDLSNQPLLIENIFVYLKTKAIRKNGFNLGPFISDKNGIIQITKADFMNEVSATYDSGLMDYSDIESTLTKVEIKLYSEEELKKMIDSRTNIWSNLLNGEKERWGSIEKLIESLKNSNNKHLELYNNFQEIIIELDGKSNSIKFRMKIKTKANYFFNPKIKKSN